MGYFLPSFVQKRLLKYALSRVGLVDTEALDLDNLGIRWGQRSTVELRDVGLKAEVSWILESVVVGELEVVIDVGVRTAGRAHSVTINYEVKNVWTNIYMWPE
jgi:hypothetical protein